ncbi:MAG: pectin methylesterase [Lachnospiraceae bacterium]|nr:pectin methylesterase [Lachnospiraceae bacterium]
MCEYIVDWKDRSCYGSLCEAFNDLPAGKDPVTVIVKEGIYRERPNLKRDNVTLIGEGNVRIVAGEYALRIHEDGRKVGTFRTATFMADCDGFTARNITFENDAGQGSKVGQALALYGDGQEQVYENCRFYGFQDTIFLGPLPPSEIQIGGFLGEKQFAERRPCSMVFKGCRIEGNIDYIFGGADARFEDCVLFTRKRETAGDCYVTAASTPEGQERGFLFDNCRFESDAPKGTVYLGRPWRNYARTEIRNSYLDAGINPIGWHDWNKPEARNTVLYTETGNYGPGAGREGSAF